MYQIFILYSPSIIFLVRIRNFIRHAMMEKTVPFVWILYRGGNSSSGQRGTLLLALSTDRVYVALFIQWSPYWEAWIQLQCQKIKKRKILFLSPITCQCHNSISKLCDHPFTLSIGKCPYFCVRITCIIFCTGNWTQLKKTT